MTAPAPCPNCRQRTSGLVESESGVVHCGCYYGPDEGVRVHCARDPGAVRLRIEEAAERRREAVRELAEARVVAHERQAALAACDAELAQLNAERLAAERLAAERAMP